MNPWLLIPIMVLTIVADWTVMILVGHHLQKTLTETAKQAVADGAEDVKKNIFELMPAMVPMVIEVVRNELVTRLGSSVSNGTAAHEKISQ